MRTIVGRTAGLVMATMAGVGCGSDSPLGLDPGPDGQGVCSIPQDAIFQGARRDGIPALSDPPLVRSGQPGTRYVRESDRVIGLILGGRPVAIPLNILWWHEVVNLTGPDYAVVVTHCPLTGSSLAFDRSGLGGVEFGVSGLLYNTNLIMYDRSGPTESLWPQMIRGARCGTRDGQVLPMVPIVEATWAGWTRLHPETVVVTEDTGFERDYRAYPYGTYDVAANAGLLFPIEGPLDPRRPPKERVLGVPSGTGGVAFPFGALDDEGDVAAIHGALDGAAYVVLWEAERRAAMAFRPAAGGRELTFTVRDGRIQDEETGSIWRMDGRAVDGPLAGAALAPIPEAFVAFWFAWPLFYPDVEIWPNTRAADAEAVTFSVAGTRP